MKPPFTITSSILSLVASISKKLGTIETAQFQQPSVQLRRKNQIRTIQATLAIEGNSMKAEQITAILESKRVLGPAEDILEVRNALHVYSDLASFSPSSLASFLKAHHLMMKGLVKDNGKLRTGKVGIAKGSAITHIAPPPANLKAIMQDLFTYIKTSEDHILVKSCVVHYEIEFIHPFSDGNGRMGRLWQSVLLMEAYPVFAYLPFETIIKGRQSDYYQALERSDSTGDSAPFIHFMLEAIDDSLEELIHVSKRPVSQEERLHYFISLHTGGTFSRKDYLNTFKNIAIATASRDLKLGVLKGLFAKTGDKRNTIYVVVKK